MSGIDSCLPRLLVEEGFRAQKYLDSRGIETIGYGFNIAAGISPYAAKALATAQLQELEAQLLKLPWYAGLDPARQGEFLDIGFNDGLHGLLGFVHCISAAAIQDWGTAHDQLLDSDAARADPNRYDPLAAILLTGQ